MYLKCSIFSILYLSLRHTLLKFHTPVYYFSNFPRSETWMKRTVIGCLTCQSNDLMDGSWSLNAAIYSRPLAVWGSGYLRLRQNWFPERQKLVCVQFLLNSSCWCVYVCVYSTNSIQYQCYQTDRRLRLNNCMCVHCTCLAVHGNKRTSRSSCLSGKLLM